MSRGNGGRHINRIILLTFLTLHVNMLPVEIHYESNQVTAAVLDKGEHYGKVYPCTPHTRVCPH